MTVTTAATTATMYSYGPLTHLFIQIYNTHRFISNNETEINSVKTGQIEQHSNGNASCLVDEEEEEEAEEK